MQLTLKPGRYVVAVSGGVDSTVLLDLLRLYPGLQLTVAHFDHGIRADSAQDARFVAELARRHGLPYVRGRAELGSSASEAQARQARYDFLHATRRAAGAEAVVTAHHQDDRIETAIHNIIRGTGRRGLTSLQSTDIVKRPLLHLTKAEISDYARRHNLQWREDPTNVSDAYTRNRIRHNIVPRFDAPARKQLLAIIDQATVRNAAIDSQIDELLTTLTDRQGLRRGPFIQLPHAVAVELMAGWLRRNRVTTFDRQLLERLVHAAKTFAVKGRVHLDRDRILQVSKTHLALRTMER